MFLIEHSFLLFQNVFFRPSLMYTFLAWVCNKQRYIGGSSLLYSWKKATWTSTQPRYKTTHDEEWDTPPLLFFICQKIYEREHTSRSWWAKTQHRLRLRSTYQARMEEILTEYDYLIHPVDMLPRDDETARWIRKQ